MSNPHDSLNQTLISHWRLFEDAVHSQSDKEITGHNLNLATVIAVARYVMITSNRVDTDQLPDTTAASHSQPQHRTPSPPALRASSKASRRKKSSTVRVTSIPYPQLTMK